MPDVDISQEARITVTRENAELDISQEARVAVVKSPAPGINFSQTIRITVISDFTAGSSAACRGYVVV
jgi:hypothetical protein